MKETRDSITDVWGERTAYIKDWPERVDERVAEVPVKWVQSACVLCSNGCGCDIGVNERCSNGYKGSNPIASGNQTPVVLGADDCSGTCHFPFAHASA